MQVWHWNDLLQAGEVCAGRNAFPESSLHQPQELSPPGPRGCGRLFLLIAYSIAYSIHSMGLEDWGSGILGFNFHGTYHVASFESAPLSLGQTLKP